MFNQELRDLLRSIVKDDFEQPYGKACLVSNVHQDDAKGFVCDCEPIDDSAKIIDVRLQPSSDGQVLIKPSDGSIVFITYESESQAFVSMYGKIDEVILFDGGKGGVPVTSDLVTRLNILEDDINDLKQIFNTWVPVAQDGGAALKTALAAYPTQVLTKTKDDDIQNDVFLQ